MLLSDSIRNIVYPASFFFAVGSVWTLAWSNKLADRCNRLDGPIPGLSRTADGPPTNVPATDTPGKLDVDSIANADDR